MDLNYITTKVLTNWFSADTLADNQLKSVIIKNKYIEHIPTHTEICRELFRVDNVFFEYKPIVLQEPMNYPAHIGTKTVTKLIEMLGQIPKTGVECGSFIGSSACVLGNLLKSNNGTLICIDTWCGDINMWLRDEFDNTMNKKDGNPKIYDYFMKNILKNDLTNIVIPFRISSIVGARTLKILKYVIDFAYVDSAHECGETFMELSLFWNILRPGGVILGDDYNSFPAVKHDLDLFCKVYNCNLTFSGDDDTWLIKKVEDTHFSHHKIISSLKKLLFIKPNK